MYIYIYIFIFIQCIFEKENLSKDISSDVVGWAWGMGNGDGGKGLGGGEWGLGDGDGDWDGGSGLEGASGCSAMPAWPAGQVFVVQGPPPGGPPPGS